MNAARETTQQNHHSSDLFPKQQRQQRCKPWDLSPTILRSQRLALKLSQSELGRRAGVSRPKICIFELGGAALTANEQRLIRLALQREAECLRNISTQVDFGQPESLPSQEANGD